MNIILIYVNKPFREYEHLMQYASLERREKIHSLKNEQDKSLALLSHLRARYEASIFLGIPFSDVKFTYNAYGKPFIENCNFHFSLSHSGNLIAFASHTSPVGIDVQKITTKNDYPALRFLTANEQNFINNIPENLFKIWTMKEAYVKMLGTGLSTSFKSFDVLDDNLNNLFFTKSLPGYYLSVCAEDIQSEYVNIKTVK